MKVIQKKTADGMLRLEANATADEVNSALNAAHVAFANMMGLQPVKGKTVAEVVEEQLGIKNLDSIVESSAIEALVPLALDKKNIVPAYSPKAEPKTPFKRGRPFTFSLNVTMKPVYELKSYDPVEITVRPFAYDEKLVDAKIAQIAQSYTSYVAAEPRPIEAGDTCFLSMECSENGKPLVGLTTKGRTYMAGQGHMPEGFDSQISGMQPGETKSFTFEGPGVDEDRNEVTQVIDCTVTIKEIQKAAVPEIDDEWVHKNAPMYKDYADFRGAIASSIESDARREYDNYLLQLSANELAKRFEGSIADEVYESMRDTLVRGLRSDLQRQNKTWEAFVEENGGEQQVGMMLMLQTREVLIQGFALDAVYRHEHLTLDDKDIEAACLSMRPGKNPAETRRQLEQSGTGFALRETAERIKANRWVLDHALVKEAQPREAAE